MIQRGQNARFALDARHAIGVTSKGFRKKLDDNTSAELRVHRLITSPIPPDAQVGCRPASYSSFGGRKYTAIHPVKQSGKTLLAPRGTNT